MLTGDDNPVLSTLTSPLDPHMSFHSPTGTVSVLPPFGSHTNIVFGWDGGGLKQNGEKGAP